MSAVRRLAENLAAMAEERIEGNRLGLVGGVVTVDDELELFELPREQTGPGAIEEAWQQVQLWVTEHGSVAGGLAYDLLLVEPDDEASNDLYEVTVEGRDSETLVFLVPFRRRRLRGVQFAGRVYTEPERLHLTFD